VAGTKSLVLTHACDARQERLDGLGPMTRHDDDRRASGRECGIENQPHHGYAEQTVSDLWQIGLHPGALASGEDEGGYAHDGEGRTP
jgi:hypothetical protein